MTEVTSDHDNLKAFMVGLTDLNILRSLSLPSVCVVGVVGHSAGCFLKNSETHVKFQVNSGN